MDRIVNGGFDTDLAGWTVAAFGTSTGTWSALDDGGSGASGSARTEMVYNGPGNANFAFLPDDAWVLAQLVDEVPSGAAALAALTGLRMRRA